MKQISILGCGWLGRALAKRLLEKGYSINGSVRSERKSNTLRALGILPYVIQIENIGIVGAIKSFVSDADIIITTLPPGLRQNPDADYAMRITHILKSIPPHSNCKILHLSSIGVFGASQGEVDETTVPKPTTAVGNQLLEAEKAVLELGSNATIVRLGGLVGDGRHPVKQLAGKTGLPAPLAPTNLVHQNDVVSFLTSVIEGSFWGHTFHCVSPLHQKRAAFYTKECKENELEPPQFLSEKSDRTKKVLDTISAELFGFVYNLAGCHFKDC